MMLMNNPSHHIRNQNFACTCTFDEDLLIAPIAISDFLGYIYFSTYSLLPQR